MFRRLVRWCFRIGAGLSLLLSVAALFLWVRSYWVIDAIDVEAVRPTPGGPMTRDYYCHSIWVQRGHVCFVVRRGTFGMSPESAAEKWAIVRPVWTYKRTAVADHAVTPYPAGPSVWNRLGFYYDRVAWGHMGTVDAVTVVVVPMWALFVAGTLLPLVPLASIRVQRALAARRRARRGLCSGCGYDLRASRDRCPECGRPIRSPPAVGQLSSTRSIRSLLL